MSHCETLCYDHSTRQVIALMITLLTFNKGIPCTNSRQPRLSRGASFHDI